MEISVHFDHSYFFTYKTLGWAFSMFKMFKNLFVKRVSPDTWLVPLKICKLKMGRAPKSIPSWFGRVVVRIHSDLHFFYFSCVLVPLKSHKLRNNNHKIRQKFFFFACRNCQLITLCLTFYCNFYEIITIDLNVQGLTIFNTQWVMLKKIKYK